MEDDGLIFSSSGSDSPFLLSNESSYFGDNSSVLASNTSSEESNNFCGPAWSTFGKAYGSVHGYTSLIVCVLGCIMNGLNFVVLTRRGMISPTNVILTGLAVADFLNMLEYMPFAYFMKVQSSGDRRTKGWALYVLIHSNFSQVCHTISIWLTVTLAVWRYIMVAMPVKNKTLCTMERAKLAVAIAYASSLVVCIPVYLTFSVKTGFSKRASVTTPPPSLMMTTLPVSDSSSYASNITSLLLETPTNNGTSSSVDPFYVVHYSALGEAHGRFLVLANFWIYSVVIKIIPCIVLTVVSLRLINSLMEAKRRKEKLLAKNKRPNGTSGAASEDSGSDRTTKMLLAVLLLFLITEFPQGILGLLSGVLDESFFQSCYIPLGDLMDFTALLNSAINFILYCSMSKKFRDTFVQTFHLQKICWKASNIRSAATVSTINPTHSTVV